MDRASRLRTAGFPRMHKERGERRDYLPGLVATAALCGLDVVVESGIGSGMGLRDTDYTSRDPRIRIGGNEEAFAQDLVVTLRSPETDEFSKLRRGATLASMLHFQTRPARVEALRTLGIGAIALDRIADDTGRRLVVNARAVGWNGVEAAFDVLERDWPAFRGRDREPVRVLVTGVGAVGRFAVEAATKVGNVERRDLLMADDIPGVIVNAVGRNVTIGGSLVRTLLSRSDILVDASQRDDASRPLISNAWIADLPAHAVICDLVVDPYLLDVEPPTVRSIEGIPRGNLDKYVYHESDPDWTDTIPEGVPTRERRTVVSCYSWPGIRPRPCMELYGAQLAPLLEVLIASGGTDGLQPDGSYLERALHRGSLASWLETGATPRHTGRGALGDAVIVPGVGNASLEGER